MLTVAQLAPIKDRDPYLYETLAKIVSALNATSANSGVDPANPSPAPPQLAALKVQAANGWFDLAITDPAAKRALGIQESNGKAPQSERFLLTTSPISYIMLTSRYARPV